MNDRVRNPQAPPTEVNDLSDLRASMLEKSHRAPPATNTDLSTASIQSIPVARLTARAERRALSSLTPTPTFAALREQASKEGSKSKGATSKPNGIFKNPYFRYKGGPIARLVAFIANVLKALEQALFRRPKPMQPRPQTTLTPNPNQPVQKTPKATKRATPAAGRMKPS